MTPARTLEELVADVWTLRSKARVGSYQHVASSGPWLILLAAEADLRASLTKEDTHGEG